MDLKTYVKTAEPPVNQSELAREIGVAPALLWQWLNDVRPIAAKHAIPIERATGGKVPRHITCPEVYPPDEYKAA